MAANKIHLQTSQKIVPMIYAYTTPEIARHLAWPPTKIIYRICPAYILGFTNEIKIHRHNIRLCDSLACAKAGTLNETLDELFQTE